MKNLKMSPGGQVGMSSNGGHWFSYTLHGMKSPENSSFVELIPEKGFMVLPNLHLSTDCSK